MSPTSWFDRTIHLNFDTWKENMSALREFTWSARVLQFLPLAGAIALARRSLSASGLLLAWLLGYVVVKGAADVATVESGSYWRLIMPALPAFALLTAAVPLLVPTFLDRMGPRLAPLPGRRPGLRTTAGIVAFVAVVPIVWLLASSQQRTGIRDGRYDSNVVVVDEIEVPSDASVVRLDVRQTATGNVLTWEDSTARADTFYRVYRGTETFPDLVCERAGADRCELRAETLGTTREHRYVDPAPPAGPVTYRIGVAANWLDETDRGDVFAVSPWAWPGSGSPATP
jgi:hypothetical protein